MNRFLLAAAALILLPAVALAATSASPVTPSLAPAPASVPATIASTPDPAANPVLAALQKMGSKFYYLGNRNGLDGWFIIKNGQVQVAYAPADNKAALIGAMYGDNGDNITAIQVSNLMQNNKEVADLMASAQKEQSAISQVGSPAPATAPSSGLPSASMSPGERLIRELSLASTVVVGIPSSPEVLMVMDPHCPFCQATFKALHDALAKGSVHLRLVPIANEGSDNERAAAILLATSDPMASWDKYIAGDKTALEGVPSTTALAAVRANHVIIDKWNIQNTPYLVYRGKDGKVKIIQGKPDNAAVLLSDLGV